MRSLVLPLLLLPGLAQAEGHLLIRVEGDARLLVDGDEVGTLDRVGYAPLLVEAPARHGIRVESHGGTLLAERNLDLADGETFRVLWDGERLAMELVEAGARSPHAEPQAGPSTLQTARAGAAVASMIAPSNPVVVGVSSGLAAVQAGSTLVQAAQSTTRDRGPAGPGAGVREDHDLAGLAQSDFDPYAASGGRPAIDASLAAVTFVAAPGTAALITVAGQPVATFGSEGGQATVPVVPGLHKVMIYDASGVSVLHRGYLTATAGVAFELSFTATAPPVSTLPDTWR